MKSLPLFKVSFFLVLQSSCSSVKNKSLDGPTETKISDVTFDSKPWREKVENAVSFLNTCFPTVRVLIDSDSPGFGHQSASLEVANSLYRLGYNGKTEIVTNEADSQRIQLLSKSLNPEKRKKISFITPKETIPKLPLGFVGGWDEPTLFPDSLATERALILQPLQWPYPSNLYRTKKSRRILSSLEGDQTILPKELNTMHLCYHYDSEPTVTDFASFSKSLLPSKDDRSKRKFLNKVIQATEKGKIDFIVAYSLWRGVRYTPTGQINETLVNLSKGLHWAQKNGQVKGTVVLVLDAKEHWKAFSHKGLSASEFTADDYTNLTLPQKHEVRIALVGTVPQPLFKYLVQKSTLATVLEGANTTNFVRLLKRPYITTYYYQTDFPPLYNLPKDEEINQKLHHVTDSLIGTKEMDGDKILGEFFEDSRNAKSEIFEYFNDLGEENSRPQNDQVSVGLVELHKYYLEERSRLSQACLDKHFD